MKKLSPIQLRQIKQLLQQTNPHRALEAELYDHIASLIEHRMDQGQSFPAAAEQVMQQANARVMAQLNQSYSHEFSTPMQPQIPAHSGTRIRMKRRPATRPFQYMQLSAILSFLLLIGFLFVVSSPLAIPMDAWRTAWGAGGLVCLLLLRWWVTIRHQKAKRLLML